MNGWERVTDTPDALGESPFWHPAERRLYWVDVDGRKLRRCVPGASVESWDMPSEPGCIAPIAGGGLVVALRDGIYRASDWGAPLQQWACLDHDVATMRCNDGKADPAGRMWAGTIHEPRDAARAVLWSVEGDGPATLRATGAVVANGLAWSPDARTVYWSDTPNHVIRAWDWDAASGAMTGERIFRKFAAKASVDDGAYLGRPDGAAVDSEGCYWCAMYEGHRVLRLAPDGTIVRELPMPVRSPTMPCFGGDDLRTLYVTSARGHVYALRVGVPGLPVNFVAAAPTRT
jgi:sugar lactone lactonase YvrE